MIFYTPLPVAPVVVVVLESEGFYCICDLRFLCYSFQVEAIGQQTAVISRLYVALGMRTVTDRRTI